MSTQLFLLLATDVPHRGTNTAKLSGVASGWQPRACRTTRGSGSQSISVNTVAGPTNGLEFDGTGAGPFEWISDPLDADVTISGTITFNIWAVENNMSANAGMHVVVERLDSQMAVVSTVVSSEKGTELPTTAAAQNWTAAATSTNFQKGDRIRIRVAINDVGTMAATFTATMTYNGNTAAAAGDSFVTFTETFGFQTTAPAGSKLYLTDVAGPAVGANVEKEMWTAKGDGSTNTIVRNTVAGFTAPLQWTDAAGGTAVEWYSKQLAAFTLTGLAQMHFWGHTANIAGHSSIRAELAVCNDDGSGAVVWAATNQLADILASEWGQLPASSAVIAWNLAGDDLAVTDGQRLRLRLYLDDAPRLAMGAGTNSTITYDGTTDGASGDSWIQLEQTVSEFAPGTAVPPITRRHDRDRYGLAHR